jgi:hypothetical protein
VLAVAFCDGQSGRRQPGDLGITCRKPPFAPCRGRCEAGAAPARVCGGSTNPQHADQAANKTPSFYPQLVFTQHAIDDFCNLDPDAERQRSNMSEEKRC